MAERRPNFRLSKENLSFMAKPKLSDFKNFLREMTEIELREELFKLFGKLTQVQEFYAQELLSGDDRKVMLDDYKKKIYSHFYTRTGNPKSPNNAEIRKLITAFEKVSVFPIEVIDLLLYRVEVATEFASEFGGMPDADYNAAYNAFEKAMKLTKAQKLEAHVRVRCLELFNTKGYDDYLLDWLEQSFEEHIGR